MKKIWFLFSISIATFFGSCSNELNLIDDWRDVTVVYTLLNQQDTAHYVVVQRAYLDPATNAFVQAQIPDSIYYAANDITVELRNSATDFKYATLQRVDAAAEGITVDQGVFASSPKWLYKTTYNIQQGLVQDPNRKFKIVVVKNDGEPEVVAETNIVKDFTFNNPQTTYNFPYNNSASNSVQKINWQKAPNASIYDITLVFTYREIPVANPSLAQNKTITWNVIRGFEPSTGGVSPNLEVELNSRGFYSFVANNLEPDPTVRRCALNITTIIDAGGADLAAFMRSKTNVGGLASAFNPINYYSNVTSGYGIVSSRYRKVIPALPLNGVAKDSLALGIYTKDLGFLRAIDGCN